MAFFRSLRDGVVAVRADARHWYAAGIALFDRHIKGVTDRAALAASFRRSASAAVLGDPARALALLARLEALLEPELDLSVETVSAEHELLTHLERFACEDHRSMVYDLHDQVLGNIDESGVLAPDEALRELFGRIHETLVLEMECIHHLTTRLRVRLGHGPVVLAAIPEEETALADCLQYLVAVMEPALYAIFDKRLHTSAPGSFEAFRARFERVTFGIALMRELQLEEREFIDAVIAKMPEQSTSAVRTLAVAVYTTLLKDAGAPFRDGAGLREGLVKLDAALTDDARLLALFRDASRSVGMVPTDRILGLFVHAFKMAHGRGHFGSLEREYGVPPDTGD